MRSTWLGIMVMVMIVGMSLPANALVIEQPPSEPSFWQRLFGQVQSVVPQNTEGFNPKVGSVYAYYAMQRSTGGESHACGAANSLLGWQIRDSKDFTASTSQALIVEADRDTSRGIAGAPAGVARIKFLKPDTYTIRVRFTCGSRVADEASPPIRVGGCVSPDETLLRVGQSRCYGGYPQAVQNVNGCLAWVGYPLCAANQPCTVVAGKAQCQPRNECSSAGAITCTDSKSYKQCEWDNGALVLRQHSVPQDTAGFEWSCSGSKIVRGRIDPCRDVSCDDQNEFTADSCTAGSCVYTPDCQDDTVWDEAEQVCVEEQQACSKTTKPCKGAQWLDYPECSWDKATCDDTVVQDGCVKDSDCSRGQTCDFDGVCINEFADDTDRAFQCSAGEIEVNGECQDIPAWALPVTIIAVALLIIGGFSVFMLRRQEKT